MKRIFIAAELNLNKETSLIYQRLQQTLSDENIRWVAAGMMHLTIRFLGDSSIKQIDQIHKMLQEKLHLQHQVVHLNLKGLGIFKKYGKPAVLWFGIEENEKFADMYQAISDGLSTLGIEEEKKPFKPHLTLGRIRQLNNPDRLLYFQTELKDQFFQQLTIREITLFESILKKTGPEYIALKRYTLSV